MTELSKVASSLGTSQTRLFDKKARDLKQSGKDVLFFTLGEPDFATPKNVKRAANNAIKQNYTHYTNYQGIVELREAVSTKLKTDNELNNSPEEIVITAGAVDALYLTFQCLLNPGDEIIVSVPSWPTCFEQIRTTGAEPVFAHASEENNFEPHVKDFENAITPKTKAILINSPCNPTGAVFSEKTLKKIADICKEKNLWLISDEIYEKLTYGFKHVSPAKYHENTVTINGMSKAYAMTGWRIGYAAGNKELISKMASLQAIILGNPTSISQKAALEALQGNQNSVNKMKKEFRKRRDLIVKLVNEIELLQVTSPKGAFYVFPNISQLFGKKTQSGKTLQNSLDVAEYFLEEALVGTTPGKPFGSDKHLRISYACSEENILNGMARIKNAVAKLV